MLWVCDQSVMTSLLHSSSDFDHPGGSDSKEAICRGDLSLILGEKIFLEEEMTTHPPFLPGELHGTESLVSYSPWNSQESE